MRTLLALMIFFSCYSSAFSQWTGATNTTDPISRTGNVGIGATTTPNGKLHVNTGTTGKSEVRIEADTDNNNENDNPYIALVQDGNAVFGFIGLIGDPNTAPQLPKYHYAGATTYQGTKSNALFIGTLFGENVQLGTNSVVRMTINENGNVGIGTATPGSFKLAVEGKIGAREVQILTTNPFPDYVFEADYKLLSLLELEAFIKANKHLPGIPTAVEVKDNGLALGELSTTLVEKVEELTLYVIQLEKMRSEQAAQLQAQTELMNQMKLEIEALKKKVN